MVGKKANKAKRGKDKYYHLAKEQGYRARSAFKLIQLNKKYDFLGKSRTLLDLCAAPGGWLQVAAKYMPSGSTIVGVDIMPIKAIHGVITHTEDITTPSCRARLRKDVGPNAKVDVVLHDGAPNVGQNWAKDAFGQSELTLHALKLATEFLRPKGIFITKVFRSADYNSLLWVFHQLFGRVEATKPHSSRSASAEIFVVCRDYKAPDKIDPRMLDIKFVFKEVEVVEGSGLGMAGGGGGGGVDVLHKKNHKERSREGYDESLGPMLTRKVSIMEFLTARDPVRALTDASAFVFDARAAEAGVLARKETTDEIKTLCGDLKIIGRGDFKTLLRWRLGTRHALPDIAESAKRERKAKRAAANGLDGGAGAGEGGGDDDHGDDEDDEEGEEGAADDAMAGLAAMKKKKLSPAAGLNGAAAADSDEEEEMGQRAMTAELSAAAADELRRKRREEKRVAKARSAAIKRHQLGMNAVSLDLNDGDGSLFSIARIRRMAASRGINPDDALDELADHDLEKTKAAAAADEDEDDDDDEEEEEQEDEHGLPIRKGRRGRGHSAAAMADEAADDEELEDDGAEDGDGAIAAATAGSGKLFDALRAAKRSGKLDELEEELDVTYARSLANKEKAAAAARAKAESGKVSHGIKLTRRAKLEQQALLTEATLNARLDKEHTRYLSLLAGARGAAITADNAAEATARLDRKRKREAEEDEMEEGGVGRGPSDDEEGDEEEDAVEDDAGDADELGNVDGDDDDDDDGDYDGDDKDESEEEGADDALGSAAAAKLSAKAARWFSRPEFAGMGRGGAGAGAGVAGSGLGLSIGGRASASAASARAAKAGGARAGDSESEEEGKAAPAAAHSKGKAAAAAAAKVAAAAAATAAAAASTAAAAAASLRKGGAKSGALTKAGNPRVKLDEGGNPIVTDKDGDAFPDWMAGVPKSEREKRKDRLRKEREREARRAAAAARLAGEGDDEEVAAGFKTVATDRRAAAADADEEFEAVAAAHGARMTLDGGVVGGGGVGMDVFGGDGEGEGSGPARSAKSRELIRMGMGSALRGAAARGAAVSAAGRTSGGFDVVPAGAEAPPVHAERRTGRAAEKDGGGGGGDDGSSSDDGFNSSSDEEGPAHKPRDPRLDNYDSDEHAELLALGAKLKRHSTAKALLDASYNRYAFDDSTAGGGGAGLPVWFRADENAHFRPQLPISKAELDALKARFRDIAARPVHKVAEARARKKRRVGDAMERAKHKASAILENEELGARSKAKAIASAYKTAKGATGGRPKMVTQVNRKGKMVGTSGGKGAGRGARTKVVDTRMKKEVRAAKRKGKHDKGKNANRRKTGRK